MELLAESFKRVEHNSLSYPSHYVKVEVEVMDGRQRRAGHLAAIYKGGAGTPGNGGGRCNTRSPGLAAVGPPHTSRS